MAEIKMNSINIKGKEYVTVNERLKAFRDNFKDYALITEIIELGADYATIKASVIDNNGVLRATGFAREVVAKSPINKFAFLENAETSAIGRALGNFGIGIDTSVCTADELLMKLSQEQSKAPSEKTVKKEPTLAERVAGFKKYIAGAGLDELNSEKYKAKFNALLEMLPEEQQRELTAIHNERAMLLIKGNE